jgi:hypothetical protein
MFPDIPRLGPFFFFFTPMLRSIFFFHYLSYTPIEPRSDNIRYDLLRTGNVEATTNKILEKGFLDAVRSVFLAAVSKLILSLAASVLLHSVSPRNAGFCRGTAACCCCCCCDATERKPDLAVQSPGPPRYACAYAIGSPDWGQGKVGG